jgi:hypothetical protein
MKISEFDKEGLTKIRKNIDFFMLNCFKRYSKPNSKLLDIAPQIYAGAKPFFTQSEIFTLDIDENSGATYIDDLCGEVSLIPKNFFDYVVCTEVLEHTLQPFKAVENIFRCLKTGGGLHL